MSLAHGHGCTQDCHVAAGGAAGPAAGCVHASCFGNFCFDLSPSCTGAGGTQRLPRLVGLPEALAMATTGAQVRAQKAKVCGARACSDGYR